MKQIAHNINYYIDTLHSADPYNPKARQEIKGLMQSKPDPDPGLMPLDLLRLTIKLGHLLTRVTSLGVQNTLSFYLQVLSNILIPHV